MKVVTAFSPGHIPGIFQICDEAEDPLLKGSRGAGITIDRGVTTKVSVKRATRNKFEVRINGEKTGSAKVSEEVLRLALSKAEGHYNISVEHRVNIPIGSGIGSSGAGALSLALALNEALELGLTKVEAARLAHTAEIRCKTGLGTVAAEFYGGFRIGVKPGAPGVAETLQIPGIERYKVIFLNFGPLSTKKLLSDPSFRERVNGIGARVLDELIDSPSPEKFMLLSRRFAEEVGLISDRVRETLSVLDRYGYTFSMAMLGETVFGLARLDDVEEVKRILEGNVSHRGDLYVANVDFEGARLI